VVSSFTGDVNSSTNSCIGYSNISKLQLFQTGGSQASRYAIGHCAAMDTAFSHSCDDFDKGSNKTWLYSCTWCIAYVVLKVSYSAPKILHTCSLLAEEIWMVFSVIVYAPSLTQFLRDIQWLLASLLVRNGGLCLHLHTQFWSYAWLCGWPRHGSMVNHTLVSPVSFTYMAQQPSIENGTSLSKLLMLI